MVREDLSEEKYFSGSFKKCQCVLGKEVVSVKSSKRWERCGLLQELWKVGLAGVWSASEKLTLRSRQGRLYRAHRST